MKFPVLLLLVLNALYLHLQAQDKYEYTIIEYSTKRYRIAISKNSSQFSLGRVHRDSSHFNATPFIAKVQLFEEKGWEVMSFNTQMAGRWHRKEVYIAYLRRKMAK